MPLRPVRQPAPPPGLPGSSPEPRRRLRGKRPRSVFVAWEAGSVVGRAPAWLLATRSIVGATRAGRHPEAERAAAASLAATSRRDLGGNRIGGLSPGPAGSWRVLARLPKARQSPASPEGPAAGRADPRQLLMWKEKVREEQRARRRHQGSC